MTPVATSDALSVRGIVKAYAVPVLREVDFSVGRGEVHALVGANGAGKSTLARIIAGLTRPDGGALRLDGAPYAPHTRRDSEAAGVRMVMQEINSIGPLTVAENIFLNRLPRRLGFVRYGKLRAAARRHLDAVGLPDVDPSTPVERLGVGRRQLVEIAAALSGPCRLLILDEPTAALTDPEIDILFSHIRRLQQAGVGILYISHRMEEIRRIADRVSVLRDGRMIDTLSADRADDETLVRLMTGPAGEVKTEELLATRTMGAPLLRVEGLRRGALVRQISFEVRAGEILGLAGLVGSGRTETLRAIFGADRPEGGSVFLGDSDRPLTIRRPSDAVRAGIGMIPEDRKCDGLLLTQSVVHNTTLARMARFSYLRAWIRGGREVAVSREVHRSLDTRCASLDQPVAELSGGNQQKTLIARWLARDCQVYLFDEPTRGIDVAARAMVHRLIADLAARGKAVVVASSDLEELIALCDRMAVLSAGRLAGIFNRDGWSRDAITAAAFSGYAKRAASAQETHEP